MTGSPLFRLHSVRVDGAASPRLETSVDIPRGITAVVGPSGAGKTTLLEVCAQFAPAYQGHIEFHPAPDAQLPLFWAPASGGLWPHLDARAHLRAVAPAATDLEVEARLAALDLGHRQDARPDELSLGERSRLELARALASGAATLLLDEPLGHVDLGRVPGYWERAVEEFRTAGTDVVFASHQPELILGQADTVLVLEGGRITFVGTPEELYRTPSSPTLATLLGPTNWLPEEERSLWQLSVTAPSLRPESLLVEPREDGGAEVVQSVAAGVTTTTTLREVDSGAIRAFRHRTGPAGLAPGVRVVLRACLLLCLCLLAAACDHDDDQMGFAAVSHRHLSAYQTRLPAPRGITTTRDGGLLVLDNAGRVLRYDAEGNLEREWMMPDFKVGRPEGVCELRDGRVAVADTHYSRVVFFGGDGTVSSTVGRRGTGPGQFLYPVKVIQDPKGNLYVAEYGSNDRVQKFTEQGEWLRSFGSFGSGPEQFQRPSGLVWKNGKIYVTDAVHRRIQVFTDGGDFVETLGGPGSPLDLRMPYDLAAGPDGNLYTCEYDVGRVTCLTDRGQLVGRFGRSGRGPGQLATPWGITVSSLNRVLVADTGNRRIVEWRR